MRPRQSSLSAADAEAAAQGVVTRANNGDFDGKQGLPGNSTMRVDTTVGTRIFIIDGVTERMISGDTNRRSLAAYTKPAEGSSAAFVIRRTNSDVEIYVTNAQVVVDGNLDLLGGVGLPLGWRPGNTRMWPVAGAESVELAYNGSFLRVRGAKGFIGSTFTIAYKTNDPWPTTLPGTPA